MSKENEKTSNQIMSLIERNDLFKKVLTYFFTYTGKATQENAKQLKFWQKVLLESNLLDDPEHRIELDRIVIMVSALSAISKKFKPQEIIDALRFCEHYDACLRMNLLPALEAERMEVTHG